MANFNTQPDKIAIGRINESLSSLQQARDLRLRESESALKSRTSNKKTDQLHSLKCFAELSRNLATISHQYNETVAAHRSIDHASHIVELDTQKFRIAKAASDLDIEGERLEQELDGLKNRLHELDIQGVEGDDAARLRREVDDPTM